MAIHIGQLSFVDDVGVVLEYDRRLQPPEAEGPRDVGCYVAGIAGVQSLAGLGGTAERAVADLALALHRQVLQNVAAPDLSPRGQALAAALVKPFADLQAWLSDHATDPVLVDDPVMDDAGLAAGCESMPPGR